MENIYARNILSTKIQLRPDSLIMILIINYCLN